jgi:hypothetical protein
MVPRRPAMDSPSGARENVSSRDDDEALVEGDDERIHTGNINSL